MSKRIIVYIILSISLCLVILSVFSFILLDRYLKSFRTYAELPTTSTPGLITLTSDACCFWLENITVSLVDESGTSIAVFTRNELNENQVLKYKIHANIDSKVQMTIKFTCQYAGEYTVSQTIIEFSNTDILKQTGVLLSFQERDGAYLLVKAGDQELLYKQGKKSGSWELSD